MNTYDDREDGEAFALPDLWKASKFCPEAESPIIYGLEEIGKCCSWALIPIPPLTVAQGHHESRKQVLGSTKTIQLRFPDLETFEYGPLDDVSASESSAVSLHGDEQETAEALKYDVWIDVRSDHGPSKDRCLKTWEAFYDPSFKEPITYVSEAGPRIFDAALLNSPTLLNPDNNSLSSSRALSTDPVIKALLQLSVGRQSSLFEYDDEKRSFVPRPGTFRVSGYSIDAFKSICERFTKYGNEMVDLRSFVDKTYNQRSPCATLVAAAATVSSISLSLLAYIWQCSENIQSLLQLQALFDRPGQLMSCLHDMTRKISKANSNEMIISSIFNSIQTLEYTDSWLRPIALQILSSISKPWLESLGCSIGLQANGPIAQSAIGYHTVGNALGNAIDAFQLIPDFFKDKEHEMIAESRHNLELLRSQSPDHVMLYPFHGKVQEVPELGWHFDWTDVERMEAEAKRYEASVLQAMKLKHRPLAHTCSWLGSNVLDPCRNFDPFGASLDEIKADISDSCATSEQPSLADEQSVNVNPFQTTLQRAFSREETKRRSDDSFAPALAVTPVLSFRPILAAQSRLLNLSCLQMLFKEHDLRSHLQLQRQFHLFGDGMFTSRLSHALFDTEFESAERRKGHVRTGRMGLKLGSRDSWPPASSELRLVLMGILTESYHSAVKTEGPVLSGGELPGGLSFALRDLSEAEIQRCMELHSIEALDFLRLQYKAPSPLDTIITNSSLDKYDTIFRLLLRVTRMLFVVNQLSCIGTHRSKTLLDPNPIAIRFRFEAHRFVSTIGEYFSTVAVGSNWDRFETEIQDLERRLDNDDLSSQLGGQAGLRQLRLRHEQMLDSMMFALLSRKRQHKAAKLLEDIFGLILAYNKGMIDGSHQKSSTPSNTLSVELIYCEFRASVRAFIDVCRSLVEQDIKGHGIQMDPGTPSRLVDRHIATQSGPSAITQLVLKLEMNNHYSKRWRE